MTEPQLSKAELAAKVEAQSRQAALPHHFARHSTVVYGIMAAVGVAFVHYGHHSLGRAFHIGTSQEVARQVAISGLAALVLLVLSYFFEDWFRSFRELKALIMRFLGPCSPATAVYLALLTAFGEELLFRGALQPYLGLGLTSLLFGLMHVGRDSLLSTWSLWALIAGLLLGWMYQQTGSLWPPIIAHFLVNTISILGLRRAYRSWHQHAEAAKPSPDVGP